MSLAVEIEFRLNGVVRRATVPADMSALVMLRDVLGLTGTKYGCGEGQCGACLVVVDGEPSRSCLLPVRAVEGTSVTTIEGLFPGEALHPVQQAFLDEGAAVRLLHERDDPGRGGAARPAAGHAIRQIEGLYCATRPRSPRRSAGRPCPRSSAWRSDWRSTSAPSAPWAGR